MLKVNTLKTILRGAAVAVVAAAGLSLASPAAQAAGGGEKLVTQTWTWDGVFGYFDNAQLRRGFEVYQNVCSACHGIGYIRFRNLTEIGFTADEAKAIAEMYQVQDGPNDDGDMFMRPAELSDSFPQPFENEQIARLSNNGAYPLDLSLITKARPSGSDYVFTLLTSFEDEMPADFELSPGMYYNPAFHGAQIAMPMILFEDSVMFDDGSPSDVESLARDVTAFLTWAAEPTLEQRKSLGVRVMIFLIVMTALFYALKRRIWARIDH